MAALIRNVRSTGSEAYFSFLKHSVVRSMSKTSVKFQLQPSKGSTVAASSSNNEIIIPKRINRGPTDILEALASTVSRDYNAPHYKFHDDPFLIPSSNASKRSYALSKESGRKAARWIRDQYPNCFVADDAEPKIPVFSPKEIYTKDSEVSVDMLRDCIAVVDVSNSIAVFQNLKSKGVEIDNETQQQLLELLCFYNCQAAPDEDFIEENWFRGMFSRDSRRAWRGTGLVDDVFNGIEPKDGRAYAAMIRGLAKHMQSERAWLLYKEMQEKQFPLDVGTYNVLIRLVSFLRETSESRWQLSEQLLIEMNNAGLNPNLGTLNAILENLSKMGSWREAKKLALQMLAEMKNVGIDPCLGSYYFLLLIFCRERGPISTVLYDIMKILKGTELTIRDPKDVHFFVTAMDVCHTHLQDKDLAFELDALLNSSKNRLLIGDSLKEAIYYQHLFRLLCETDTIDTLFEYYNKLVPNVYTPEPSVMLTIINAIKVSGSLHHIPRIWSDMVSFDHHLRENLIEELLVVMANGTANEQLQKQFAEIAFFIQELVDGQRPRRSAPQVQWTGQMLANAMMIFLKAGEYDKACGVLEKCEAQQHRISGSLTLEPMEMFIKAAIEKRDSFKAIMCVQYMADCGFPEARIHAESILNKLELSDRQKSKTSEIISTTIGEVLDESV